MKKEGLIIGKLSFWQRLGEWVLKRRWWLVAFWGVFVLFFELVEYELEYIGLNENTRFVLEIIFFAILPSVSIGLALSGLSTSRAELFWSVYYQNLKYNLDRQLHTRATRPRRA
jgi:hypothetical protein